jgi:hypothetical protein
MEAELVTPGMEAQILAYFEERQQMRAHDRAAVLRGLTKREQQLIREAAVMGYVRGAMAHSKEIPADSDVLALVIGCCLNFPDLYPAMKRARRRGERAASRSAKEASDG